MAEDDASSYPPIEPSTFDLIVIGTGLSGSILAAAASAVGKSALHIDPNPFYGSHYASLTLHEFTSFLTAHSAPLPHPNTQPQFQIENNDYIVAELTTHTLYSDIEVTVHDPEALGNGKKFNLDLAGPRVLYRADSATELVVKSGIEQYMEFRAVDGTMYVGSSEGRLDAVPDSREAVFKDRTMSLKEKNQLTRFFKLVQSHLDATEGDETARISPEDLDGPFADFLNKMRLPEKIKSIILYAISMADYDQDNLHDDNYVLKTKDGIDRLVIYQKSVGRFNAPGAFLYPQYGQGELPQAFCRRAAVKGCIYVLRMPVLALLMDKTNEQYKGVRLASGQMVFSSQIVLDPCYNFTSPIYSRPRIRREKVARGICIIRKSLKPDSSTFVVVYPPRSLHPEQMTSVRVLQVAGNLNVCPSNMYVVYFAFLCFDADQGKRLLHTTMSALSSLLADENSEDSSSSLPEKTGTSEPSILWNAFYIQELIKVSTRVSPIYFS
uniref:Rab GDP dissociation inhibitor n=1 Tax=Kalanchoe fedtschenkoi TaxID=63787 RepID=A0A7N0TJ83_KALFE